MSIQQSAVGEGNYFRVCAVCRKELSISGHLGHITLDDAGPCHICTINTYATYAYADLTDKGASILLRAITKPVPDKEAP